MTLSVIIVTHNSAAFLGACLDSLDRHLPARDVETCVVDNASTDESRAIAARRHPRVRLVANGHNVGFAAAVNRGLAETTGRHVLWLNPDAVLLDDGTRDLVMYLDANPGVGVVGPRILDPDGQLQRSARAFPSYICRWRPLRPKILSMCTSTAMPISHKSLSAALSHRPHHVGYGASIFLLKSLL